VKGLNVHQVIPPAVELVSTNVPPPQWTTHPGHP